MFPQVQVLALPLPGRRWYRGHGGANQAHGVAVSAGVAAVYYALLEGSDGSGYLFSALDPVATARIEGLIHSLKEHYTIVIVTHNMQQAARVSDETAFFLHGCLIEHGGDQSPLHLTRGFETEDYITGKFG